MDIIGIVSAYLRSAWSAFAGRASPLAETEAPAAPAAPAAAQRPVYSAKAVAAVVPLQYPFTMPDGRLVERIEFRRPNHDELLDFYHSRMTQLELYAAMASVPLGVLGFLQFPDLETVTDAASKLLPPTEADGPAETADALRSVGRRRDGFGSDLVDELTACRPRQSMRGSLPSTVK